MTRVLIRNVAVLVVPEQGKCRVSGDSYPAVFARKTGIH